MSFEVLASGYGLVEGPTADRDGSIVFSDVFGGGVYRLAPSGDVATIVPKRRGVGGIALHADGGVVVSGRDVVHVHEGRTGPVLSVEGALGWNDLCTDAAGGRRRRRAGPPVPRLTATALDGAERSFSDGSLPQGKEPQ